jgi:hypothetical protein
MTTAAATSASYTRIDGGGLRPKQYRPKTVGDARRLIIEVFSRQREEGWDERDIRVYLEGKGVPKARVEDLSPEETRAVMDALERASMIIFND